MGMDQSEFSVADPARPGETGRRVERWAAAFVLGLPFLYLVTDHSFAPVLWHYSLKLIGAIVVYSALFGVVLRSYRWRLPSTLELMRRVGVAVGAWTILGMIIAEGVLAALDDRPDTSNSVRLRGYTADPDAGYVYTPNHRQMVITGEWSSEWAANSQGVRADQDYGAKPPGVTRILGLGDSFTVSVATSRREAWPGVLEQRLNEEIGPPGAFEVVNAGHAGYGTMQALAWLKKFGKEFHADIVLLAMTPNDIGDNGYEPPGNFTAVDGYLAGRGASTANRIRFEHRMKWYSLPGHWERSHLRRQIQLVFARTPVSLLMPYAHTLDQTWTRFNRLTEQYLLEMQHTAAEQGARFGVILITFRAQLTKMPEGFSPEVFGERWSQFAREHDIPVIDTYPVVLNQPDPQALFWRWDDHYNVAGERMTGDVAFALMQRSFLGAATHRRSATGS